ncbi:unnamed protein product, partial [Ectocarpus fasciculatus]
RTPTAQTNSPCRCMHVGYGSRFRRTRRRFSSCPTRNRWTTTGGTGCRRGGPRKRPPGESSRRCRRWRTATGESETPSTTFFPETTTTTTRPSIWEMMMMSSGTRRRRWKTACTGAGQAAAAAAAVSAGWSRRSRPWPGTWTAFRTPAAPRPTLTTTTTPVTPGNIGKNTTRAEDARPPGER